MHTALSSCRLESAAYENLNSTENATSKPEGSERVLHIKTYKQQKSATYQNMKYAGNDTFREMIHTKFGKFL